MRSQAAASISSCSCFYSRISIANLAHGKHGKQQSHLYDGNQLWVATNLVTLFEARWSQHFFVPVSNHYFI